MSKVSFLKKLLKLEIIGWLLVVLALFGLPSLGVKWGALLILLSNLFVALEWEFKFCQKTGTCFRKQDKK